MHCKPHQNGNPPSHFRSAGQKINAAARTFLEEIYREAAEPLNGRNYQHLSPEDAAQKRNEDLMRLDAIKDAAKDALQIGVEMFRAGEE